MSKKQPEFSHHIRRDGDVVIVEMRGALYGVAATKLKSRMDELLNDGAMCVVFDCQQLSYTGFHGYRVVLAVAKELQLRKGRFALCNLIPDLKDLFQLATMMDLKISISDSLDGALAAVRNRP